MADQDVLGKPVGGLCRNASQLVPGKEYKIKYVYQELSRFTNFVTKNYDMKTICVYEDLDLLFYTYLCKDYDNKTAGQIKEYNDNIKAGHNIRLIYYGSVGNYNMTRLLTHGQKPNNETKQGMKAITNAQTNTFFLKRKKDDDDDDRSNRKIAKTSSEESSAQ
ncbi:uncharacterized protein LOC127749447 [Frankliniella occidentalis]|uniref:Uncharacterized protein LOC127749447 n=1 Tax=Frankliniella occidentalis TaxID=133901 RepID=A0A9C6TZY2_FRAOC|nr:uncharacterized protein LOC127749447 [Frankliniella occidentalis]